MPMVTVQTIEGTLSPEQKSDVIARVTDAVVAVEGEFVRPYTWVIVEEVAASNWGFGGQPVTAEAIDAAKSAAA
jgi:4-oxalocrotonate tautomerase